MISEHGVGWLSNIIWRIMSTSMFFLKKQKTYIYIYLYLYIYIYNPLFVPRFEPAFKTWFAPYFKHQKAKKHDTLFTNIDQI